ncbi:MAG TPA: hypothetical protein VL049_11175 [Candidatus Dormibacteraeota bacterium]|nr:hypothetical protein [Candidatus Dormibacteraeota bacterium]
MRLALGNGAELAVVPSEADGEPAFALRERGGGLRHLAVSTRGVGRFLVQVNEARALRPPPARDRCGFACDDPRHPLSIVERRPRLTIDVLDLAFIPQGFPIDPRGHWLIVPSAAGRLPHRPQRLRARDVAALVQLAAAAPAALLFYNSLDAGGGTVDHLHAQLLAEVPRLPTEALAAASRGLAPLAGWPAPVLGGAVDAATLTDAVLRLQAAGVAFNLLLRGGVAWLAGRVRRQAPSVGLVVAALEVGGLFVLSDPCRAAALDQRALETALRETLLPLPALRAAIAG